MMGIFLVCRTIGMASSMMILQARRRFGWWQFVRASSSSSWKDDGGGGENAYTILGLQRSCSVESIRAAFRELAKATHPDLQPNCADDDDSRRSSAQQFVRVLAAYQIHKCVQLMMLSFKLKQITKNPRALSGNNNNNLIAQQEDEEILKLQNG